MSQDLPLQHRETSKAPRPCNQRGAKTVETPAITFPESLVPKQPLANRKDDYSAARDMFTSPEKALKWGGECGNFT